MDAHAADPAPERPPAGAVVAGATALLYTLAGGAALLLAGPPAYASPLYPAAGLALAAALVYGRAAWLGVLIGAATVNASLGWLRGAEGSVLVWLPLVIGVGAAAQAALGAVLVRRWIGLPLVLNTPRDILLAGALGAVVACTVSPSLATLALGAAGTLQADQVLGTWITWWLGDTLGALIGAPLVLTVIGRPREDWRPRLRTVGLPLVVTLSLLAAALSMIEAAGRERERLAFERRADRLLDDVQTRLRRPLFALQALHGAALAADPDGPPDDATLRAASAWWLQQRWPLRAVGYSERVPRAALAAYEARAREEGDVAFSVFERDGGAALARDGEAVVLRRIQPRAENASALGVNALSIPAARQAILAARDSGEPAATAGFRLTQAARDDEIGIVLYQALYDGQPRNTEERRSRFRGALFVTVAAEALFADGPAGLREERGDDPPLMWCLVDGAADAARPRLAGNAECPAPEPPGELRAQRPLEFGGRPLALQVRMAPGDPLPAQRAAWPLTLAGFGAVALLGAMLLMVTGHARRTELAVRAGTAELRREIHERHLAEQALRQSEVRLRTIIDNAPLGVAFLDPQGGLLEGNQRLHEMLRTTPAALRGRRVTDVTHPDDVAPLVAGHRALLAGQLPVVRQQMRMIRGDGSLLQARAVASALRDEQGRITHMVAVLEDIEEHLRLEEAERAVHRAEASSRAKSEFVSRMSHELRTPLNAMIGFAQLLALDREPGLAARQLSWAQEIQRAGWHLLELINDTLDLARIESGALTLHPEPVALAPMVASCRALLGTSATQRQVAIHDDLPPGLPPVQADATRLRQVLTNLLSNAIKYNRAGGDVHVRAHAAEDDSGQVCIVVADNGLGMSESQLQGLFQPYNRLGRETSGVEGTGIGLVISRGLAELMGGSLHAESRLGEGSTLTLRLPAAASGPAAADAAAPVAAPAPPYQRRHVLYIEDNETNVEVMRGMLLQRPQVQLEVATLGLDGLEAARRHRPDLILLDMQLPDISGLELLRHFKSDDDVAGIPVIVVSADATPARMQEALTIGAAQYITKPVALDKFLATVDQVLESVETRWMM